MRKLVAKAAVDSRLALPRLDVVPSCKHGEHAASENMPQSGKEPVVYCEGLLCAVVHETPTPSRFAARLTRRMLAVLQGGKNGSVRKDAR